MREPQLRHLDTAGQPPTARATGGFTLMELMVVLVMIGILMSLLAPKVGIDRWQARASAQAVGTTLLTAQRDAIVKQANVIVDLDATNNRLRVGYDSTGNGRLDANERSRGIAMADGTVFGRPADVPAMGFGGNAVNFTYIDATSGLPAIMFYRNGSAQEFGGLYITSLKALNAGRGAGKTWALSMNRATGRAEWSKWNGVSWVRGF
jgi:prepilin-type N-terminal cleavage/methylation domain-containing protein